VADVIRDDLVHRCPGDESPNGTRGRFQRGWPGRIQALQGRKDAGLEVVLVDKALLGSGRDDERLGHWQARGGESGERGALAPRSRQLNGPCIYEGERVLVLAHHIFDDASIS